jgi:ribonuclease HII
VFGADEAGKGPVFGPMVAAAVSVPAASVLPDDVGDSKGIAPERRERLAAELREDDRVSVGVATVGPDRIDDPVTDMNTLTVAVQAEAIAAAATDGEEGIVDAGDTDEGRFGRRVADRLLFEAAVHAEHGADERYPVVGAASVVAKVERDRRIEAIADEYGDVGSGYPSDPTTRTFLREYVTDHGTVPPFARESWSTCQEALRRAAQSSLEEF